MSDYVTFLIGEENFSFFLSEFDCRTHIFIFLTVDGGTDHNRTRSSLMIQKIAGTNDIALVNMSGKHKIWLDLCLQNMTPFRVKRNFNVEWILLILRKRHM